MNLDTLPAKLANRRATLDRYRWATLMLRGGIVLTIEGTDGAAQQLMKPVRVWSSEVFSVLNILKWKPRPI